MDSGQWTVDSGQWTVDEPAESGKYGPDPGWPVVNDLAPCPPRTSVPAAETHTSAGVSAAVEGV